MLERLEVYNFKSYKGHQVIGPFKPFSCIIGPNGAGKSNLMDAISFVLGVRSAQLRSIQLKDLIYRAGARQRDDQQNGDVTLQDARHDDDDDAEDGQEAAKKAWVMAVYLDTKAREWKYQRTITAAGQSEYRINGKVVKADAYNAQLEKQNILVKAKNFLVFQGDVEAVASQQPKDITRLIEQISGSLELKDEYERAKVAQEKASEISTNNFNKRRGINSEIRTFKEQKSEAERFAALRLEHEAAIVRHLLWKIYHAERSISEAQAARAEIEESIGAAKQDIQQREESVRQARKEYASLDKTYKRQEKKVKQAEKSLEAKRPAVAEIDTEIQHLQKKLTKLQNVIESVERDRSGKTSLVDSAKSELAQIQKTNKRFQEESRRKQRDQRDGGIALSSDALKEYNRLKSEASRLATAERSQFEEAERTVKSQTSELEGINDKLGQLQNKLSKNQASEATLSERAVTMDNKVKNIRSDLDSNKAELEELKGERKRISQSSTELNEKLEKVMGKLSSLDADRRENAREKALKATIAKLQEILSPQAVRGRVVDLCKPQQRKYDQAVTVVLGRNLDSIVVDSQKTAIECMDFMRQNRAGVATFIPLDTITPKPIDDRFRTYARGARLALDVIEYESDVERAMLFACGNALVCDTLEVARHVVYEKGQEVRAVSLDGTLINKAGLMTGGQDNRNSRQWDEQEVKTLKSQKERYQAQLQELLKSRPKQGTDEKIASAITTLETDLAVASDDLSATKDRLRDAQKEIIALQEQINTLERKATKAINAIDTATTERDTAEGVISVAEDQIFAAFCKDLKIKNIRVYESKQLQEAQADGEERLRLERQIARLENTLEFEQQQFDALEGRVQTLRTEMLKVEGSIEDAESKREQLAADLVTLQDELTAAEEVYKGMEATVNAAAGDVELAKKAESKAKKMVDKALQKIAAYQDQIERAATNRLDIFKRCKLEEIDLPLLEGDLADVPADALAITVPNDGMDVDDSGDAGVDVTKEGQQVQEFGLELDYADIDEAEKENDTEQQDKEFTDKIEELQGEIDQMSPNMKAMNKLDEVEAKLAATAIEHDQARKDAKEAKDAFNDVKRRRTDLFQKAFDHISGRIDKVYKELTTGKSAPMGGAAYLTLDDSDEPYLHGIQYNAMPPMKRFRDMEQLSGGEKSMAAMALLFAIHSFHPSPFFVLDEVDAALDNTNVGRIAHYLRMKASSTFQFVVISLKNSLWEEANGLVGIWRDVDDRSSKSLTLDLDAYGEPEAGHIVQQDRQAVDNAMRSSPSLVSSQMDIAAF